jgi:FkbM family methyltransferase
VPVVDPRDTLVRSVLAARSFLHGRPLLNRALAPIARPVLRHVPRFQHDPALSSLERFALASGPVTFIQLGAHDGLTNDPLHDFVMSRPNWSGVVVEPVPEHYEALRSTYAAVTNRVRFERAVVGDRSGHAPFYRLREVPGLPRALRQVGSLSREHVEQYASGVSDMSLVVEEQVASTTLSALLDRHDVTRIDLLHMDIEGAEPIVLSQIDFTAAWAPRALLFEHNHLSTDDFQHWKIRLRAAGYVLEHGRQDTWAERIPQTRASAPTGFTAGALRRIELTTAVRDTDRIPKVPNAGQTTIHDGVRVQIMHCGVLIEQDCYYGSWMTEVIRRLRGHHEPQEEVVFHELMSRLGHDTTAPVMVELGSYWAYYTLWLKHLHPEATCILVEPDPQHLRVGQRNLALNRVDGHFIRAAAGREHGGQLRLRCESDSVTRTTPLVSVDGLLATQPIDRIDVLVCDVQGAELDVLGGAQEALRTDRIRFLLVSTHAIPRDPVLHQRCLAFLQDAGAHIIAEHSIPESCSGDGLIVASFDPRDRDLTVAITIGRARDSLDGELEWRLARLNGWRGLARQLGRPLMRYGFARALVSRARDLERR